MGFFGGQSQVFSKPERQIRLDDNGAEKLQKLSGDSWECLILSAVKKHEPCSVREVAQEVQRPEGKVRIMVDQLVAKKWLKVV